MSEPMPPAPSAPVAGGPMAPMRNGVFRMLWFAWLAANISLWMHDVAAAWMMTSLTTSPALVALVQTASTLPMFLLGVPSGALADIVDRRRYFAGTQLWAACIAVILVGVSLSGNLTAPLLLELTLLNGITMAMRWPVFAAIVPTIVPRAQLAAALALNGVAMNLPRIVGPALAGALLASLGSAAVFAFNAALSIFAFVVILRWKAERKESALPGERFVGAMRTGLQYARQAPKLQLALLRITLFMLQVAGLAALVPLLAKRLPDGGAGAFSAMLAATGVGAICVVLFMGRTRERMGRDLSVRVGTIAHALAATSVVFAPNLWLALPGMFVTGAAVLMTANTITVSAQLALPDWVRARGMAIYQMALMGGAAAGAALWGQVANVIGVSETVLTAAAFGVLGALVTRRLSIEHADVDEHRRVRPGSLPEPAIAIDADDGPVMVTVEYQIDTERAADFARVMQATRRARLRQGALSWGLSRDAAQPGRYVEYFVDENWLEHQRRLERFTAGDAGLREQRLAFHLGPEPPVVRRYVADTLID
ncbi:MAG: MFS transporter [Burkholderiaceae bacterium]